VPGRPEVFACGDAAAVPDLNDPGKYTAMTAQHAWRHGKAVAQNVAASLGIGERRAYRHRDLGFVVDLGGTKAAANPLGIHLPGPLAGAVPRGYHLAAMPGNRVRVAADWLLDAVLPRQAVQLGLVRSWSVPLDTASPELARVPGRPTDKEPPDRDHSPVVAGPEARHRATTHPTPDTTASRPHGETEPATPATGEHAGKQPDDAQGEKNPGGEPARNQPGGEPAKNQPGESAGSQPGAAPAKSQRGGGLAKGRPRGESAQSRPGAEPAKGQPGGEPAASQPGGEPAKNQPGGEPARGQSGGGTARKQSGAGPAKKQPGGRTGKEQANVGHGKTKPGSGTVKDVAGPGGRSRGLVEGDS